MDGKIRLQTDDEKALYLGKLILETFRRKYASRVTKGAEHWGWDGGTTDLGYVNLIFYMGIHRFSFMEHNGYLTPGLVIDHVCERPVCSNPEHLEEVTQSENISRRMDRGGMCRKDLHAMTPDNTLVHPNGKRQCRECKNTTARDFYHRSKNGR